MSAAFKKFHRLVSMVAALAALAVTAPAIAGGVNPNPQDAVADQADGTDRLIIKYRKGTAAAGRADLQTMSDAHTKVNRTGAQMQFLRKNTAGSYVMKLDRELGRNSAPGPRYVAARRRTAPTFVQGRSAAKRAAGQTGDAGGEEEGMCYIKNQKLRRWS